MRRQGRRPRPAGGGSLLSPTASPRTCSPKTCALCGTPCREPFRPPPAETAPDLDLRPGEPTRSTLPRWVTTCRGCGATAPDLAVLAPNLKAIIDSPPYRTLLAPTLAFQRWALLADPGPPRAEALLEAAWALDDQGADATTLRARAAAEWGHPDTMQDGLRLVDILRRAGNLATARHRAETLLAQAEPDGTDAAVLRYQLALIATGDQSRHLLSSALRPPARTPHVTHGKTAKRGFWQKLTGG